ncbi:hypothetical protein [Deinococcus saxicola]|uniref:hypothetical protein n=1 Tax=Deinococcus saxicola TaxID=249406 RepID=UPI0039F018F0
MTTTPPGHEAHELWNCEQALLAEYMLDQGGAGSFFQAIAEALRRANPANLLKLYLAFPEELHGYLIRQRAWAKANHRDQA